MTAPLKAPTKPSGYVEDSAYWSAALAEFGELVPDLMWPTSVWTYAQMRKDPQLAGIGKAYTYPLRRASWHLNPAGCRDEVVQLVADDLGLKILGDDEKVTAARVRGVSWKEHLRAALLSLFYGHMGFEELAEIRDGRARLIALSERMPHTIGQIRINPDGSLAGVDQWAVAGQSKMPQIGADRLAWYCNEREGAAWQGQSLLRPAFAPWLFKREMQRVLATSNRRFGMGVPTMEALPGTNPTPEQTAAAMKMATSIRVGDQGGAATPPGWVLKLIGLSGSVPDTKAFLDWLNQEMSRMALTGFLDLGQTPNGSRALGESFINLFLMALKAVADDIADTATRQISARIVEWNWGTDEPVPQVVCADVGTSHEVTAQAISELVKYGAIQPDESLDEFVRREWGIPKRTTPYLKPEPPGLPQAPGPSTQASIPKRRPARAVTATAPAGLRRDLTAVEAASGADFSGMQQQWQDARTKLQEDWADLAAPIVDALAAAAAAAVIAGALSDLGTLTAADVILIPAAAALTAAMTALARQGADDVVAEAAAQGAIVTAGTIDTARLGEVADAVIHVIASGYANGAARQAMLVASTDVTEQAVYDAVTTALDSMTASGGGWVSANVGSALSLAQHEGRMATFAAADTQPRLIASEVLDWAICDPCEEIDGTEYPTVADALADYPTGRYKSCLGQDRCRGMVVALWPQEAQ